MWRPTPQSGYVPFLAAEGPCRQHYRHLQHRCRRVAQLLLLLLLLLLPWWHYWQCYRHPQLTSFDVCWDSACPYQGRHKAPLCYKAVVSMRRPLGQQSSLLTQDWAQRDASSTSTHAAVHHSLVGQRAVGAVTRNYCCDGAWRCPRHPWIPAGCSVPGSTWCALAAAVVTPDTRAPVAIASLVVGTTAGGAPVGYGAPGPQQLRGRGQHSEPRCCGNARLLVTAKDPPPHQCGQHWALGCPTYTTTGYRWWPQRSAHPGSLTNGTRTLPSTLQLYRYGT
jgi:hypothetical protein